MLLEADGLLRLKKFLETREDKWLSNCVQSQLEEGEQSETGISPDPGQNIDDSSSDNPLVKLVAVALRKRYGPIPREIVQALDSHGRVDKTFKTAADSFSAKQILDIGQKAARNASSLDMTISHLVIAIYPVLPDDDPCVDDDFGVDFRSTSVAQNMTRKFEKLSIEELFEKYDQYRNIPNCIHLAARLLETIMIRSISRGQHIIMEMTEQSPTGSDRPCFLLKVSNCSLESMPRFPKHTIYNFDALKSENAQPIPLEPDVLYQPKAQNHPLFDFLAVQIPDKPGKATIWVLRSGVAAQHEDSREGYISVRRVMQQIRAQMPSRLVEFVIKYVYITDILLPQEIRWQMPENWTKELSKNNHQGKVYCLKLFTGRR